MINVRALKASLIKASFELDRAYNNVRKQVDDCDPNLYSDGCLLEINRNLPHFQFVVSATFEYQSLQSRHIFTRSSFSLALELWKLPDRTQGHKEDPTTKANEESQHILPARKANKENRIITTKTTNKVQQGTIAAKTGNKRKEKCECHRVSMCTSFLRFKESFYQLLKDSKRAKSVIFAKGNFPRVLSTVDDALYSYHSSLFCDWQINAAKYVVLRFQIWNLKFFTKYVNENSRLVTITDFASSRIRSVLIGPSKDSLKQVSRLISQKLFDDLIT